MSDHLGQYDVEISRAQILWVDKLNENPIEPVLVIAHGIDDDRDYDNSWGKCNSEFNEASTHEKLIMLLAQAVSITLRTDIPLLRVHEALWVIPEYRSAFLYVDHGLITRSDP